jgi:ferredoxin-NADP reductase
MASRRFTTPPTKRLQIIYGALVGFLSGSHYSFFNIYSTPELALIIGNIFAFIVSPKDKLVLKLKEKTQLARDVYEFCFESPRKLAFEPGQYLEWTLPHKNPDARGIRRYFTIASAPNETIIKLGVKIPQASSSFKSALQNLEPSDSIIATQLAGDFTLEKNPKRKLAFIAGGIGVTPFRSIIKHLNDIGEKRNIVLLYTAVSEADFAYKEIFHEAQAKIGIKIVYLETGKDPTPKPEIINQYIPDFHERLIYISGPNLMVNAYEKVLKKLNVKTENIKKDYFPGF